MAWGRWRQVRELPRGRRMEDDGAGLRGENRKSNQGGPACWVWEQNSKSQGNGFGEENRGRGGCVVGSGRL
jgi:hypothetical protein